MPPLRIVHYYIATSVDGFIARSDGAFDCFPMEGDHVAAYQADLASFDAVLMGRKTYDVGLALGVTNPYPSMKTIVFSRSLETSPDPEVELVRGDPAERVRVLKQQPGGAIYLCGGGELAGQLWRAGLIDELTVKINPLVLGAGLPMLGGLTGLSESPLALISHRSFESGVVFLRYRVVRRGGAG